MMFKSLITFSVTFLCMTIVCSANTICSGSLSGQVNGNLIVNSDCTLSSIMVNGFVNVGSGATLTIHGPSTINGGMNLNNAGGLYMNSDLGRVTINGNVIDRSGSGSISLCDVVITGAFRSYDRTGAITANRADFCLPSTIYGPMEFHGGRSHVGLDGLQNRISTISIRNKYCVVLRNNPTAREISISYGIFASLKNLSVSGLLTVERFDRQNDGDSLRMANLNVFGSMNIRQISNVSAVAVTSSADSEFSDNTNGIYVRDSSFNRLSCFNNSQPISFTNSQVNSGSGQCLGF